MITPGPGGELKDGRNTFTKGLAGNSARGRKAGKEEKKKREKILGPATLSSSSPPRGGSINGIPAAPLPAKDGNRV